MNRRQAKRVLYSHYAAGPLSPWRSVGSLYGYYRMLVNKGLFKGLPQVVGSVENFRFVYDKGEQHVRRT